MTAALTGTSRPVRAVVGVVGGWVVARAVLLWPAAAVVESVPVAGEALPSRVVTPLLPADLWDPPVSRQAHAEDAPVARGHSIRIALDEPVRARIDEPPVQITARSVVTVARRPATPAGPEALSLPAAPAASRLSGSFWALARTGGPGTLANGGQLGGSQIGMRVYYAPGPQQLAVTGRISTPLASTNGREASLGVALRGRNIGLIVEQRFALDKGGRDAPSVTLYGGVSEVKLGAGLRLDGYVQAGAVGLKDPQGFVDGAVRVERTVIEEDGPRLSAGIALSGGAQPGVSRLDIGPQLVARVPVAGRNMRVSAEWRQRIAGNAAPGSGPAVTVGIDF